MLLRLIPVMYQRLYTEKQNFLYDYNNFLHLLAENKETVTSVEDYAISYVSTDQLQVNSEFRHLMLDV